MANRELGLLDPYYWHDKSACNGADTELFYPPRIPAVYQEFATKAKSFCNGPNGRTPCPVREQCLEWAIATDEDYGIFGGMSHRERNALVRKRERLALEAS